MRISCVQTSVERGIFFLTASAALLPSPIQRAPFQTQYTYEPFGNASLTGLNNGNANQYTARENDGTGFFYYRARFYSPVFGRFISQDPIGFAGGINVYAYAYDNPINLRDPFGLGPFGAAATTTTVEVTTAEVNAVATGGAPLGFMLVSV